MLRASQQCWIWWSLVALSMCLGWRPGEAADRHYEVVVNGILSAWDSADVVCLGESHGRRVEVRHGG